MVSTQLSLLEWKLLQWLAKPYMTGHPARPGFYVQAAGKVLFTQGDFVNGAGKAAKKFVELGWTEQDKYRAFRLNDVGLQAASDLQRPEWNPPTAPVLRPRDFEVLAELEYASRADRWASTLDCGGGNGSFHSASLTKLTRHGYAECYNYGKIIAGYAIFREPSLTKRAKGSRRFRITPAGCDALAAHQNQS